MSRWATTVQLVLEDERAVLAIFRKDGGMEVVKNGERVGMIDETDVRGFAKYGQPEKLVALIEALLGDPPMTAASKAALHVSAEVWFSDIVARSAL